MEKADIKSMNLHELSLFVEGLGEKGFRAKQIYQWLHQKHVSSFDEMTNISKALIEILKERCVLTDLKMETVQVSGQDGTRKYLFALSDGNLIESVLMRYKHGNSVCISSQVGCRMGCRFCASTLDGLVRGLTPAEMIDQIYQIGKDIGERVSNVVVMGTGEPLDNFENLLRFIELLTDENGLHISQRNLTVSTCGIVPRIRELADKKLQITLALSLHASNQTKRMELMPVANKYDLHEVIDACGYYFEQTGRRVTFEYSLVAGVNDTNEDAAELAGLVGGMNCHINLIPVNPIKERTFRQPEHTAILAFKNKLEKNGINVTIRREMGRDIDGACASFASVMQKRRQTRDRWRNQMKTFSMTHIGRRRETNQDYMFTSETEVGNLPNLFLVADGMGGHAAGDYASRFTVERIVEYIGQAQQSEPVTLLSEAIAYANRLLLSEAEADEKKAGMGTTIVAATLCGEKLYTANVGDSRLYVVNQSKIVQITRDHSLVEEMVRLGEMDKRRCKRASR